jgi:hypothetical protein
MLVSTAKKQTREKSFLINILACAVRFAKDNGNS